MEYTIGADPELFLRDAQGNFRSAHNVIQGTKHDPLPVLNGAIQVDGVAAEFNINPARSADEFSGHIRDVLEELQSRIDSRKKGLNLYVCPTARFEKKYFQKLPKHAKLLGCDPDRNAYDPNGESPKPKTSEPFRTGGGHIHVGWTMGATASDGAHVYDCIQMTKQLDCALFLLSPLWDSDVSRRTLYGKVGSYRVKPYGVEYRVLSNAWVADPDLHRWIFNMTNSAAHLLDDDDVKLFDDPFIGNILLAAQSGYHETREAVLNVHDWLAEEHQLPRLPEAYTQK